MWFLWGALVGFGLLAIFSIGFPVLLIALGLLVLLLKGRPGGAWMALVGAATPWVIFAVEGYSSPDCAAGTATISPSGKEHFRCDVMHSPSEFLPFLVASLGVVVAGLVLFFVSRHRRSQAPALGHVGEHSGG